MQFTVLAITSLLGLTLAAPNTPSLLNKRDKFDKCSVFGSNCATQDQRFCDPDTGKISVCHAFGSDCWVRYTMDSCASKREPEPVAAVETIERRDMFNKCSVFGSVCDADQNEFCDSNTGKMSICHQIGWGTEDCWVQYTQNACPAKREAAPEPAAAVVIEKREPVEKRDLFNKCAAFGSDCATDDNVFCRNGRKSICHQIGWGTEDCWIQYTSQTC